MPMLLYSSKPFNSQSMSSISDYSHKNPVHNHKTANSFQDSLLLTLHKVSQVPLQLHHIWATLNISSSSISQVNTVASPLWIVCTAMPLRWIFPAQSHGTFTHLSATTLSKHDYKVQFIPNIISVQIIRHFTLHQCLLRNRPPTLSVVKQTDRCVHS